MEHHKKAPERNQRALQEKSQAVSKLKEDSLQHETNGETEIWSVSVGRNRKFNHGIEDEKAKAVSEKDKSFFEKFYEFFSLEKTPKTEAAKTAEINKEIQKEKSTGTNPLDFESEKISNEKISGTKPFVESKSERRGILSIFFDTVMASLMGSSKIKEKAKKAVGKVKKLNDKHNRRKIALRVWKERKKKAERILKELGRLKEKERQRTLSENDSIDKAKLHEQLAEIKNSLQKSSSNLSYSSEANPANLQVIFGEMSKYESFEEQIEFYKKLQRELEIDFYKRRVSEDEFRKVFLEYNQKIKELELRKSAASKKPAGAKVEGNLQKSGAFVVGNGSIGETSPASLENSNVLRNPVKTERNFIEVSEKVQAERIFPKVSEKVPQNVVMPQKISSKAFVETGKRAYVPQSAFPGSLSGAVQDSVQSKVQTEIKTSQSVPKSGISEVSGSVQVQDESKLFNKIDKLVDLMTANHEVKNVVQDSENYSTVGKVLKAPEFSSVEKEISRKKIVSDFDRLLDLVKEKGEVSEIEAMSLLGLKRERFIECCELLEQNDLIKLDYPLFGGIIVKDANFVDSKKKGA